MRKLTILLTSLTMLMAFQLEAQPFESISSGIIDLGRSYMAWGDYDNDGDLDVVISGISNAGDHITILYNNDEGVFSDAKADFKGVKDGSLEWGDYDNDDDLDLLLTGEAYDASPISLIYTNNQGTFVLYDAGFPGVAYGHATWGDYDNDGDLDVLISGNWIVKLFENSEGIFSPIEQDFGQLQSSRAAWGDFDNDGDLDILLIGDSGGGYISTVFINEKGTFSDAGLEMEGLFSGSTDWIDFDQDGDLDICLSGYDIFLEPRFLIYENLGDGNIANYNLYLPGLGISSVDWGDYDNDGDLDILACGKNASCGGGIANVYYNQDGEFIDEPGSSLDGAIRCSAAWADYDNDGDLDFLLTGLTPAEIPFSKFYKNTAGDNNYLQNSMPEAPSNLESFVEDNFVVLSWDKATDAQTPQDGLNYNLRIGTHPGEGDVLSPMANAENGFRYIQALGNTNTEVSRMIMNLPEGVYYWSVQAVDQAYAGSPFAAEQSFAIIETGVGDENKVLIGIYPNPAKEKVQVYTGIDKPFEYHIFNMIGQELIKGTFSTEVSIDISGLEKGMYILELFGERDKFSRRLVKE